MFGPHRGAGEGPPSGCRAGGGGAGLRTGPSRRHAFPRRPLAHRRPGRDDGAALHPRRSALQPHVLLHGQGGAAGPVLRVSDALRGGAEQEVQDGEPQDPCRAAADAARPAAALAQRREGRSRRSPTHRDARTPEARGLLDPHAPECGRSGRDGSGRTGGDVGRRTVRQAGLRSQDVELLRKSAGPQPHPGDAGQAAGGCASGLREPRGR